MRATAIHPALERVVREMPKAALHVHLEGALRWQTVCRYHESCRDPHPPWLCKDDPFPDFAHFLGVFQRVLHPSTGSREAIETHARHVVQDLIRQGVVYAELIVSVVFHQRLGLDVVSVLQAIARGAALAAEHADIDVRLVLGINRHRPISEIQHELDIVLDSPASRLTVPLAAIDLQGDEQQGRMSDYRDIFDRAAGQGLRLRAHAGELCGPASVDAAVHVLGASQLSHGVRCAEDPVLLRELATAGIWFHVCPTSNVMLHVVDSYQDHPLPRLIEAGCRVTIDADDPLLFGTDISEEHLRLASVFALSVPAIRRIARAGIEASLLDEKRKQQHLRRIDELFASLP